jgi:hypothetical protein
MLITNLLIAACASGISQLPSDASLQQADATLLSFGIEAMRGRGVEGDMAAWPKALVDGQTYWLGDRPVLDWDPSLRKFGMDQLVSKVNKPAFTSWILGPNTYSGAKLGFRLICVMTIQSQYSSTGRAFTLPSCDAYADEGPVGLAKFFGSLSEVQRHMLLDSHDGLLLDNLSDAQQKAIAQYLPAPGTVTQAGVVLTSPRRLVADFQFNVVASHGKDYFSALFARP